MQIILACFFIPFPGRAVKCRLPPVRRIPLTVGIPPDIIIPFGIIPAAAAFDEPGMLIRCMVHHKIHHDPDPTGMRLRQHPVKIFHGSELRIDGPVITDIISIIIPRRLIDRGKPQDINAQHFQIIQFGSDSIDISDPVSIGVAETPWIDLIDDGVLPPRCMIFHF